MRWRTAALLTSALMLGSGAGAAARKPTVSAAQVAAQRFLQQGIGAMIRRDFATAGRALADSFRQWPQPELLYYLGALAQAQGQTLEAQDLMRRYLSDPHQETAPESPESLEAARILSLPRPPHGKLQVVGEAATVVTVDGRLVGNLPLSQPLLLAPGTHQVTLEIHGQPHAESVVIQVARFVEMRYSADTRSVILSVVPVMLLIDDYQGPIVDAQKQLARAIDSVLQGEHLSPLRRTQALEGARDSSLASCLSTLPCQAQLARDNGADFALRVMVGGGSDGGRSLGLELLHAVVGDIAARTEVGCPRSCTTEDATALLQRTLPALLAEAKKRPYGRLRVESKPPGAEVWSGDKRLGLTPLDQAHWMGPLEVELRLPGSLAERRAVTIPDGAEVALTIDLRPQVQGVASPALRLYRPPRPRWRYYAGTGAAAAGLLVGALGTSALLANGSCVGSPSVAMGQCLAVHDTGTVGGALLATGLFLLGGGALVVAMPPPLRLEVAPPNPR